MRAMRGMLVLLGRDRQLRAGLMMAGLAIFAAVVLMRGLTERLVAWL